MEYRAAVREEERVSERERERLYTADLMNARTREPQWTRTRSTASVAYRRQGEGKKKNSHSATHERP